MALAWRIIILALLPRTHYYLSLGVTLCVSARIINFCSKKTIARKTTTERETNVSIVWIEGNVSTVKLATKVFLQGINARIVYHIVAIVIE